MVSNSVLNLDLDRFGLRFSTLDLAEVDLTQCTLAFQLHTDNILIAQLSPHFGLNVAVRHGRVLVSVMFRLMARFQGSERYSRAITSPDLIPPNLSYHLVSSELGGCEATLFAVAATNHSPVQVK